MIKKEKTIIEKLLPHVVAILCFLAITMLYFSPVIQGKIISQSDISQYTGASQELREYYNKEGETSVWTGSMFSGMPSYQIGTWGESPNFLTYLETPLKALGNNTAGPVFAAMLMAYILFIVMGFRPSIAALGAIAYSLSSYNIIILEAGHVTKAWALAYMPLIVASMVALFRRKVLLAGLLMALGLALQIKNNHLQMTYYTGILCFVLYIGYISKEVFSKHLKAFQYVAIATGIFLLIYFLAYKYQNIGFEYGLYAAGVYCIAIFIWYIIESIKKKDYAGIKGLGALIAGVAIAVLCNAGSFYSNYELGQESIRGKSELTTPGETGKQSAGLDKDYTFRWSYGKAETFTLMIPNLYGGATRLYDNDSESVKTLVNLAQSGQISPEFANNVAGAITKYWGMQPGTSGPVYFGAVVCFLFILGMIIIRNRMKWALLAATILFIFLSWGKNFEWFNDTFFYHFPFYNKFRAVSSALVVPALTMVIVAVWAVKEFLSGEIDKKLLTLSLYISVGVTAGICFIVAVAPGIFTNFTSVTDATWSEQVPPAYYQALLTDRKDMMTSDAWRSLLFIVLAGGVLWMSLRVKGSTQKIALFASISLVLLILIDLWTVDRRFLNDDNFVSKTAHKSKTFPLTKASEAILQDKSPSYRVLNLNNPFNEAFTSYYHKSIGGYHAAKQRRYQELIDHRLAGEINNITNSFASQNLDTIVTALEKNTSLNMLNTKYIIFNPETGPIENPYAYGNAWFVHDYKFVNNADEEIAALNTLEPLQTAVIDKRFESELAGLKISPDSTATIVMTEYKPNKVTYKSKAAGEQLAVFSEIYYPHGWQAYIDGKEVPHVRADWTLRALRIPAGEHEIVFNFYPKGYMTSTKVTTFSTGGLILLLLALGFFSIRKRKKE